MKDSEFVNYFMAVLGVLVGITAVILILANSLASKQETMDIAMLERTKERTAPIGKVNIETVPVQKISMTSVATVAVKPEDIYQSACHTCHATGVLEAPRIDDKVAWQTRLAAGGLDNLYQVAIQGRGNMPPKGGRTDLSDDDIKLTIDYMLKKIGISP